ncbi:TolC family outer membrane protein [Nitratireductor soli]|uniref:TolC family outer membrane protein n=1 Tax=Nitratireductor soli TaxID=1670619 RepID=UPI000AB65E1D|nr:TolC family outer membrane protein [Nitratireductor soli]
MRQPRRMVAILSVSAAAIASACAGNPKPDTVDPVTVSSTTRDAPAASKPQPQAAAAAASSTPPPADKGPLTLETAVQRAVSYHPSVAEAVGRLNQQGEALNEARAGYRPRVSWGVNSNFDSREGDYGPSLDVSASQMIYDFGKVDGRVQIATAGKAGRKSQVLMAVDELIRETAHAAIEIQRNQALAGVARDQVKDTSAILDLVRSRTDKGASTRSDELQAEARVQAAEATTLEVQAQSRRWTSALAALTDTPGTMARGARPPGWLSRACASADPDWSRVPAVMQAEAERSAAVAQIGLSRAESLPTLSLDAGVGTDLTRIGSSDPDYTIGLNVSGSLYNGGESGARQAAAGHALRSSEAARLRAQVDVRRSLTEATGQISSMRALLASLSKRQTMMKETRDLYRTQYLELGTRTLLDLLNADQEFHAARFDEVNIRYDLQRLGIDCAYSAGDLRSKFSLEGKPLLGVTL